MKKKLLVFTSTFPRWKKDTIPPFVYELSKRLTDEFDVSILAPSYPGAKDFEIMDKMKVYRFHYFIKKYEKLAGSGGILPTVKKNRLYWLKVPFFLIGEFLALRKLTKKIKPDIIHAHWIIPQGFIAYLNYKISKIPYIITSHGSDIMGLRGFKSIKKFVLRNAKKITVVSNPLKRRLLREVNSNLKINVIPMGVDTKLFNPNKGNNSIKKRYNINGHFLLFVGRLSPEKGIDLLIEAMPKVIEKNPETKLIIIGDGTLRDDLRRKVKELKIQNNIIFIGWIQNKDLPKYYATADAFVCPSRREGFGLTFAEAGLCGCWLIGTKEGGIKDIIKEGKNGIFVKPTSKNISEKILKSVGKKGDNKLLERFSWDNTIRRFVEVLR